MWLRTPGEILAYTTFLLPFIQPMKPQVWCCSETQKAGKPGSWEKTQMASVTNIYTKIMRQSKFNSSLCVSFPLSRIQSTCFASVFSSALTLTPFSRIFRCSQSNCAPAMADHPFFSLADARLCHLGHTPPLGMRHHHTMYQQARSCHNLNCVHWKKKKRWF